MLRKLHKALGLFGAVLLSVLALSGAVLSVLPALDKLGTVSASDSKSNVADLAARVTATYPGVEEIRRLASGKIIVFYFENDRPASVVVYPDNGQRISEYAPSAFERWMTNLHRSFFLGDGGRMAAGMSAAAMLALSVSGLYMMARRMGGWRQLLGRARGTGTQRLHVDLGRLAILGLILSPVTAIYMSLATFEVIPDGMTQSPAMSVSASTGSPLPVDQIAALRAVKVTELRELKFPYAGDPTDGFEIKTDSGEGFIDQTTGKMQDWQNHGLARRIYEFIYMLHTGQGMWGLGLLLGLMALSIPIMSGTGALVWWSNRTSIPRMTRNTPAQAADTVILVGSEGGSTWGFAATLHNALTDAGHKVHTAAMDSLQPSYRAAKRILVLTATYGDGAAPASAGSFLKRLEETSTFPAFPVAVLGFGDRQFPRFCQFARDVEQALIRKGWVSLMPLETIDRQSAQEFTRWGEGLSQALGKKIPLLHKAAPPRCASLTLVSRSDYGAEAQIPTSILRFALPKFGLLERFSSGTWRRYAAGDLLGILPPNCAVPRFYSLSSSAKDGFVEICVRKHPGGLCSSFLHGLRPGDSIGAFIKLNPSFRPANGRAPVILIGAGTGIGPLAGFIRANEDARPMHLYFGGRNPSSDFLYESDLKAWLNDNRLTTLNTAFSRGPGRAYVQDRIRKDADRLRALIAGGAQILVCGGRDMAAGVMEAFTDVLAPAGLTPASLKIEGRYAEDVY